MNSRVRQFGFTMIELLIVITIGAILMAIAIPSYRYVTTSNRVAGEINGLLGDVRFARYEAIKEGLNVTICPTQTASDTTCYASTTWTGGGLLRSHGQSPDLSDGLRRATPITNCHNKITRSCILHLVALFFNLVSSVSML